MTSIVIVDDQEMIRMGLRLILENHEGFTVLADLADGLSAVEFVRATPVDVVLMDIRMPGIDGVEATRRIRELDSAAATRIVILTTFEHDENVISALQGGANGFLSKAVGPSELVAGIDEVAGGGGALSAAAVTALIGHVSTQTAAPVDAALAERFYALTPRERDVVVAIAAGLDNDEAARQLFVSPFTVKTHASRAMGKVGARDRAQLVAFAHLAGLTS
ncbi:MAG: LuxR family transcriptional regulator [Frondihabitans sp.]|nr:LuxR family transcriptional regulator [Frondihabitans sp.]